MTERFTKTFASTVWPEGIEVHCCISLINNALVVLRTFLSKMLSAENREMLMYG